MKTSLLLVALSLFTFSCSSGTGEMDIKSMIETALDETTLDESIDSEEGLLMGDFGSDAHTTSGKCIVNEEKTTLIFQNFKTDDGPKLLVYLTSEVGSDDFVNLGDLKGINGDYDYVIPSNTNLTKYNIVVIWCIDFSVSFGHAELK